jgi:hypothetical protein
MNADFEVELAQAPGPYRRTPAFESLNRRLSPHLLWLTSPGDALLIDEPWPESLVGEARRRDVELVSPSRTQSRIEPGLQSEGGRLFTPWGWTRSAAEAGVRAGSKVSPIPFDVVARVNSKLWSHALEVELGWSLKGSATARTFEELSEAAARACPGSQD